MRMPMGALPFHENIALHRHVTMQLFVRGAQTHTLQVSGSETVQDVKTFINNVDGFETEDQIILYAGKPLSDEVQLTSFEELSTLDVEVRLLGGKVHGSLARAGKVKGQTQKVEKQEKKKSKTGRAKRRMQYNRRFGVAVAAFGRKKGPNANS